MNEVNKDRIIGAILGAVSLLYLYMTWSLPASKTATLVGPKVFPYLASGGLLLCSVALMLKRRPATRTHGSKLFLDRNGWERVAKLLGLLVLYPVLFHYAGFISASILFLFFMITLFDLEKTVPKWKTALISIGVSLSFHGLFTILLKIQLPVGVIFG